MLGNLTLDNTLIFFGIIFITILLIMLVNSYKNYQVTKKYFEFWKRM